MNQQLPDRVRLQPLTGKKAFIQGTLDPGRLQRIPGFSEVIAIRDIRLELAIETRESGLFLLNGRIAARLELVCQRCLQGFSWSVDDPIRLNASAGPGVEGYETVDLEDDMLDLEQLVEDELIVRMPQRPVHERIEDCDPNMLQRTREYDGEVSEKRDRNPFAVLKKGRP